MELAAEELERVQQHAAKLALERDTLAQPTLIILILFNYLFVVQMELAAEELERVQQRAAELALERDTLAQRLESTQEELEHFIILK